MRRLAFACTGSRRLTQTPVQHTLTATPSIHPQAKKLVPEKEGAKNKRGGNKSSKTALSVQDLQVKLPKARVCYVSGACAPSCLELGGGVVGWGEVPAAV